LNEPDFPYPKRPRPEETAEAASPEMEYPPAPPSPPSPPPLVTVTDFTCEYCGKTFKTKDELTLHVETEHQSPKKKV
jgi:hypothetical protein